MDCHLQSTLHIKHTFYFTFARFYFVSSFKQFTYPLVGSKQPQRNLIENYTPGTKEEFHSYNMVTIDTEKKKYFSFTHSVRIPALYCARTKELGATIKNVYKQPSPF